MVRMIIFDRSEAAGVLTRIGMHLTDGKVIFPDGTQCRCAVCQRPITAGNLGNIMPGPTLYCDDYDGFIEYVWGRKEWSSNLETVYEELREIEPDLVSRLRASEQSLGREGIHIEDMNVHILLDGPVVREHLPELAKTFGLVRSDLVLGQLEIATPTLSHRRLIEIMRGYLQDVDIHSLAGALAAVQLRRKGEEDASARLLESLREVHGDRGRRVEDMVLSGMFDDLVLPVLADFIAEFKESDAVVQGFGEFYGELIQGYDRGIWADTTVSPKTLARKVRRILDKEGIACVYGRGRKNAYRIEKTMELLKRDLGLDESEIRREGFDLEEEPVTFVEIKRR